MAIKKSEIYSQIWAACDKLRGGVEPARYKDYILTLLFVKYVSDRFKSSDSWDIEVPTGGSFDDIIALKYKKNIGEGINVAIGKLAEVNELKGVIDLVDFNNEELGTDKEAVDKLSGLVEIFQKPELDFTKNRAGGDDILGDAYEFLMRKFAQDSGKSKGQFYTPGEVSRIMAQVIGIDKATDPSMTVYDPACGSGSLLIRAADAAPVEVTIYGRRYRLEVVYSAIRNSVLLSGNKLVLQVRRESSAEQRENILNEWYREQLKLAIPPLLKKYERIVGVEATEYHVKNMRTKWGSCIPERKRLWLNLQLAKKPSHCLEYVIAHELIHFFERKHSDGFREAMDKFFPAWRSVKEELNKQPLDYMDAP
jgi:predicted metal-dependent hydrolase